MLHDGRCILRLETLALCLSTLKHDDLALSVLIEHKLRVIEASPEAQASVIERSADIIDFIGCVVEVLIKRHV